MKNKIPLKIRRRQVSYCKSLTSKKTISKPGEFIGSSQYDRLSLNTCIVVVDSSNHKLNKLNHYNDIPHELKDV